MKKLELPENELYRLYTKQNLSSNKLAEKFGCNKNTILKRLHKAGIKLREPGIRRILVDKQKLVDLYLNKKLSFVKIAKLLGCGRTTVFNKLRKFEIKTRDLSDSHIKYERKPFSEKNMEKAYMLGFRMGDLRVRKVGKRSKTIKVDCRSTKKEQIKLFYDLFSKYGHIWHSERDRRGGLILEAFLGTSFSFLLNPNKGIKDIFRNKRYFLSFLAGFVDADGSICISNDKAVLQIGNYNKGLLGKIKNKLTELGIEVPKLYVDKKLRFIKGGYYRSKYYWTLAAHRKLSLLKLLSLIKPYTKHEKRKKDLEIALQNIRSRGA